MDIHIKEKSGTNCFIKSSIELNNTLKHSRKLKQLAWKQLAWKLCWVFVCKILGTLVIQVPYFSHCRFCLWTREQKVSGNNLILITNGLAYIPQKTIIMKGIQFTFFYFTFESIGNYINLIAIFLKTLKNITIFI